MRLAVGMVRQHKPLHAQNHHVGAATAQSSNTLMLQPMRTTSARLNVANSWTPLATDAAKSLVAARAAQLRDKWMEYQGIRNWEGLLDPLDDDLRNEILRYGEFVDVAYRCFDFDTSSPTYATCRYPKRSMLTECQHGNSGYRVTKQLHATCAVQMPRWIEKLHNWECPQSSWIGYVAVCDDKDEIARLGRRDVVIAYRGTATCLEWLENLRATLTCLPDDMAPQNCAPMVQSGFLNLYTSSTQIYKSLQETVREEVARILQDYGDEPLSVTITGHSLGAALATLTAYDITNTFKHAPLVTVVSFGGPRVGNKSFRSQLEKSGTKVLRIVNSDDPITKVPGFLVHDNDADVAGYGSVQLAGLPSWLQKRMVDADQWAYAEVGKELRLSSKDSTTNYLAKVNVATCHDLKTYLHLVNSFVSSTCPLRATAKRVLRRQEETQKQTALHV